MLAPALPPARLALTPDGLIEGYASLFGAVDQARDMVMPGAFKLTLQQRGLRRIPMLFQHDPSEPIGIWLELREDFRGGTVAAADVAHVGARAGVAELGDDFHEVLGGFGVAFFAGEPYAVVDVLAPDFAVELIEVIIVRCGAVDGGNVVGGHEIKRCAASNGPEGRGRAC